MPRMQGSAHREGHRRAPAQKLLLSMLLAGLLPLANGLCEFPASWSGLWFQTGKPEPVFVNSTILNNRTCHENRNDMYIIHEAEENCYRCMIINERHENVIQFREELWCRSLAPLEEMCNSISSDESLISMFRLDSRPIACPFTGAPFKFSYSRGLGECTNPVSHAESCTDESKLLLKYQACPDVERTESSTEELQCLATWKDGRNKYLVGTVKSVGRSIIASNEDMFRCFLYEKTPHHQGKVVYDLAQSEDATCNGLTSVAEGARTIKLTKVDKGHNRCTYPSWVTQHHDWHSLNGSKTYHFTARNATLKVRAQDNNDDSFHEEKIVCHNLQKLYPNDNMQGYTVKLVAHISSGCDSGYVCMMFHKRDGHIIEIQQSDHKAIMPEEACESWDPSTMPYTTLVTSMLHQRKCPHPGRYTIIDYGLSEMLPSPSRRQRRSMKPMRTAERRTWQDEGEEDECKNGAVEIGCSSTSQNEMSIDNSCETEKDAFLCHGSWEENGTWYTIASLRNSKLTSGQGQTYCFSMQTSDVPSKMTGRGGSSGDHHEQEFRLSARSHTCQRSLAEQWTYRLTSQGVCEDLTKAASSTASSSSLSRVSLVLSAGAALLCTLLSR
ncbi:uncharacterized protein LOC124303534 isoform X1 [Neodiprion virginianus]|uniref:uncharacterized protein LOC124181707 isoform X1 n=2 Tax=Neodiprion fabricii TaxID=2872261 RepID=UPI001ED97083|nr:uncharacterized protein LOC124181707 isoform X1 [Neodiprion fabricii]XP_046616784.1 uncharacterized protein LOC124303534 isoform X1 [Neodiprion virginianus]